MTDKRNEVIARAKQLAASGDYLFVYQIERVLQFEGFGSAERAFRDKSIKVELRALIAAHRRP